MNILIIGESGAGKTTSMRNLNPEETLYIDCDKKGLCWKGWREQYNTEKKNYYKGSDEQIITALIKKVNNGGFPNIKNIVIDTLNGIMIDDEFSRMKEKGYDKWQDLAFKVYGIIDLCNNLNDDINVICIMHAITEREDNGYEMTRARVNGKKLEKIVVESKFSTVLLAKNKNGKNIFETKANNSTAKTPLNAFEEPEIDNDIVQVLNVLKEY